ADAGRAGRGRTSCAATCRRRLRDGTTTRTGSASLDGSRRASAASASNQPSSRASAARGPRHTTTPGLRSTGPTGATGGGEDEKRSSWRATALRIARRRLPLARLLLLVLRARVALELLLAILQQVEAVVDAAQGEQL